MVRLTVQLCHEGTPTTPFLSLDLDLPEARRESAQEKLEALFGVDPLGSVQIQLMDDRLRSAFQKLRAGQPAGIKLVVTTRRRLREESNGGGSPDLQPLRDFLHAVLAAVHDATGVRPKAAQACAAIRDLGRSNKSLKDDHAQTLGNIRMALEAALGALDTALQHSGMGSSDLVPPVIAGDEGKSYSDAIHHLRYGILQLQDAVECRTREVESVKIQLDRTNMKVLSLNRDLETAQETIRNIRLSLPPYEGWQGPEPGRI